MATFTLPATDGVSIKAPDRYAPGHHIAIDPGGTIGDLTIEAEYANFSGFELVAEVDLETGPLSFGFTGPVARYRFTLGDTVGSDPITIVDVPHAAADNHVGYGGARPDGQLLSGTEGNLRLRTDNGEPGFWQGRQFGLAYEFNIAGNGRQVIKVETPIDAVLYAVDLQVDEGDLYYRVFGSPDKSVETAAFTTPLDLSVPLNTMSFTPVYTDQVAFSTGGDIDETGLVAFPIRRIRTSGITFLAESVASAGPLTRGFGAGFAYIVLGALTNDDVTGVIEFRYENRDWGY